MINLRIYQNDKVKYPTIKDWTVSDPDTADFAFRVWGGNTHIPHLTATDDIDFAKTKSPHSFLFIKAKKDSVRKIFDNFNIQRMFSERVGGDQNPGGVVFSVNEVIKEYILTCEDLGQEPDIVDITK